jgi:hypothetical protein
MSKDPFYSAQRKGLRLKIISYVTKTKGFEKPFFTKRKNENIEKPSIYIKKAKISRRYYFLVLLRSRGFISVR